MREVTISWRIYAFPQDFVAVLEEFPIGPYLQPHEKEEARFYIRRLTEKRLEISVADRCLEVSHSTFESRRRFNNRAFQQLGITPVTWSQSDWSEWIVVIYSALREWECPQD